MPIDWMQIMGRALAGATVGALAVAAFFGTIWLLQRRSPKSNDTESRDRTESAEVLVTKLGPKYRRWIVAFVILFTAAAYSGFGYDARSVGSATQPEPTSQGTTATPASESSRIDVGGATLAFHPPAGYCFYPPQLLQTVLAVQGKVNPDNIVHAVFGNCDQLRAYDGAHMRIQDFGMLMTPRAAAGQQFDNSVLAKIAKETFTSEQIKQSADQKIKNAQYDLNMKSYSSLGILSKDDNALYFGSLSRVQLGDESFDQVTVSGLTVIKGKLLSYYLYGDYRKDPHPVLDRLLGAARSAIAELAAENG